MKIGKKSWVWLLVIPVLIGAGLVIFPNNDQIGEEPKYYFQYDLMSKQLDVYEDIQDIGGWETLPEIGDTLSVGMTNDLIPKVRQRLQSEKYFRAGDLTSRHFDSYLEALLRQYQSNNGLEVNGCLTRDVIRALNVPVEKKIKQIQENIKRWKAFPSEPGELFCLVNAPDFKLTVFEGEKKAVEMKIIIGRKSRQTPAFSAAMTHVIFNPSWHIPPGILRRDVLPAARRNHSYFKNNNMTVYAKVNGKTQAISPSSIDWRSDSFPYSVVQAPGPDNPLGVVKFMFPNRYSVYMHDTPSKHLFKEEYPMFSSGCIRLSRAIDFAYYLLEKEDGWTRESIDSTINTGKTKTVYLEVPVPVYVGYFTSWVDTNGQLQFRKDVYGRD